MPPPPGEINTGNVISSPGVGVESPKTRKTPSIVPGSSQTVRPPLPPTERHVPVQTLVEPKVFISHETTPGQVPRRIEVERKKREYSATNIRTMLQTKGVLEKLLDMELRMHLGNELTTPIDDIPLHFFDDTENDGRPERVWADLVAQTIGAGLPARAKDFLIYEETKTASYDYRAGRVTDFDQETCPFPVQFPSREPIELHRIFICFDAEDPVAYCERIEAALQNKERVLRSLQMNLYVDCMPVDNLRPLDSEQVSRILSRAMNRADLANNSHLDTSSLLQQYNLNHMRTLNQMTFVNLLQTQTKQLEELGCVAVDPKLLDHSKNFSSVSPNGPIDTNIKFEDVQRQFKFNSFWNKEESIHILLQTQELNLKVLEQSFFVKPDKTMKLEDFSVMQSGASIALTQYFKETWLNATCQTIRVNLEDVHKGWFNIEEDNLEVYAFSKLKKFLVRLNFTMQVMPSLTLTLTLTLTRTLPLPLPLPLTPTGHLARPHDAYRPGVYERHHCFLPRVGRGREHGEV